MCVLIMALWCRKMPTGVIVHSDRGSQYCSAAYQKLFRKHHLICSMSKKGDCYDNAAMESWNHSFKVEAIHGVGLEDKAAVLQNLLQERKIDPACVAYVGNDINDLPCFDEVGWAVAVADAQPEVLRAADFVTSKTGGHGAVREICDLILSRRN